MTVLTVTDEQKAELLANGDRFEVRDSAGRLVLLAETTGRPATPDEVAEMIGPGKRWTIEELDRRVREEKSYTTAEVLEHLRGLSK